ncbi:MAG: hypothetical protein HY337_04330 [Gemmatimonadetes bacterium]|nr:hypothetical protein [Gemmatimonadota bacterium]
MPVTNRLLRKLQETLGEEPTQDLVAWVGEAGAVNRQEVREVADLYLSRFDERLERRFAEFGATVDRRFADYDAKLERRLVELEGRIENKMTTGFATVRIEFNDRLSAQYRDLLRWLFIFWAGTIIPLAGLIIALVKL